MRERYFPRCCGSEDGDLILGGDLGPDVATVVQMWVCHTCGVLTVVDVFQEQMMDASPTVAITRTLG